MPIYEYGCGKCGHEFEREQRITDPPLKTCPKCRSTKVRRLISRTSFLLKGGGWYRDLYASPKPSASEGGESKGGAETKPAPKSDSGTSEPAAKPSPSKKDSPKASRAAA